MAFVDDLMHDLKVDRRGSVAETISGGADFSPRNVRVPFGERLVER